MAPPPTRTAYFSSARSPGVVLRVSVTRTLAPSAAATNACVSVAMPDRCCRKFSAVRSPASSAAAGPRTDATTPPGAIGSPSDTFMRTRVRQSKRVNTASTTPSPHTTARSRAMISASASCVSSITDDVVTSPRPTSSSSARSSSRCTAGVYQGAE